MFKNLGGLGNMASMIGAVQQLPEKMKELNEVMAAERVVGRSECGRVEMTMSGTGLVHKVDIDPELTGEDLQTAVLVASNQAGAAAKELFATRAAEMAKDMNIQLPGLENMIKNLAGGGA
ncbi:MAG: YbaB/EbfC family nucleoid-associated protein [Planctomycetota bacterium]